MFCNHLRLTLALLVLLLVPLTAATAPMVDPCTLLTKADIEAAVGKPIQPIAVTANANPAMGANCKYKVGDYGTFDLLVKPLAVSETPERILAAFKKGKSKLIEVPNLGEKAFLLFPGYGMIQLNTFKGGNYYLITLLIPGVKEEVAQDAALKLMHQVMKKV